jgi:hypothetical protein
VARTELHVRSKTLVCFDGLRRCYNGAFEGWEYQDGPWEMLEYDVPADRKEARLEFWKDLNDYAVSQRGEGARREFKFVEVEEKQVESVQDTRQRNTEVHTEGVTSAQDDG